MQTSPKRKNDLNRLRRELKNRLFQIGFARASNNFAEISFIVMSMDALLMPFEIKDAQDITREILHLVRFNERQTPIMNETRLDDLIHLLQQTIAEI